MGSSVPTTTNTVTSPATNVNSCSLSSNETYSGGGRPKLVSQTSLSGSTVVGSGLHGCGGLISLAGSGGGCNSAQRQQVQRQRSFKRSDDELIKRSRVHSSSYELSQDLQEKQLEMLERKYGGTIRSRRAARVIQRAFRKYCMNKNFEKLRNSVGERRLSKRLSELGRSNTVWTDRISCEMMQYTTTTTAATGGTVGGIAAGCDGLQNYGVGGVALTMAESKQKLLDHEKSESVRKRIAEIEARKNLDNRLHHHHHPQQQQQTQQYHQMSLDASLKVEGLRRTAQQRKEKRRLERSAEIDLSCIPSENVMEEEEEEEEEEEVEEEAYERRDENEITAKSGGDGDEKAVTGSEKKGDNSSSKNKGQQQGSNSTCCGVVAGVVVGGNSNNRRQATNAGQSPVSSSSSTPITASSTTNVMQQQEPNNNRNSYPELNDSSASDSPQATPVESAVDLHSLDFENLLESKETDILSDSFHSDSVHSDGSNQEAGSLIGHHHKPAVLSSLSSVDQLDPRLHATKDGHGGSCDSMGRLYPESGFAAELPPEVQIKVDLASPEDTGLGDRKTLSEESIKFYVNSKVKLRGTGSGGSSGGGGGGGVNSGGNGGGGGAGNVSSVRELKDKKVLGGVPPQVTPGVAPPPHHHHQHHHHHHSHRCGPEASPIWKRKSATGVLGGSGSGAAAAPPSAPTVAAVAAAAAAGGVGVVGGCTAAMSAMMNKGGGGGGGGGEVKRMSNISETSEPESVDGQCSSSPSSDNVSSENISIGSENSISYQRKIRISVTPDQHVTSRIGDKERKRLYRIGLNLFNKKPEKGLRFLIEHGFVDHLPANIAKFLLTRKGLSKQMIGEYLGNLQNPLNQEVLDYFAEEIDLSGLQVDVALRKFQSSFRMPGEAQKIEKLMEAFAHRYCICNPDQIKNFRNPDTIFLLAFAIIMLNTDLHNSNIKSDKRMKLEDFIKNLRGIDETDDIDRDLLRGIYERIRVQDFQPGVDHQSQVMKVEQTIVGKKPQLALPHRRLVCYCRLYEIHDPYKKEKIGLHQREVFLFNDIILITKIFSKKKTGITYSFKQYFSLYGMQAYLFETSHYQYGIRLSSNGKVLITFNARNDHDRQKFVEDLKEAILETTGLESLRIEEELQRHRATRNTIDDDSRVLIYDVLKPSEPAVNRLSAPECGIKKSSLSSSLLDICEGQGLKREDSGGGGSTDSGVASVGTANTPCCDDPVTLQHQHYHQQQQQQQQQQVISSKNNNGPTTTTTSATSSCAKAAGGRKYRTLPPHHHTASGGAGSGIVIFSKSHTQTLHHHHQQQQQQQQKKRQQQAKRGVVVVESVNRSSSSNSINPSATTTTTTGTSNNRLSSPHINFRPTVPEGTEV
ncbi:IQ motif and SEC7 domain-containing protein 2 isoform X2 [Octopus sinensis]|uniref:IQ motif and SEC7 domain-containing protein 2 isoform X2 n=1 Tax=Octopus sinensis TaxID=2607531 RepID=A0A6P7TRX9_9MOLL|nr:IQ motif and SEC7 domain-containing protein 2 isoform X2 [Octopus sinensis]